MEVLGGTYVCFDFSYQDLSNRILSGNFMDSDLVGTDLRGAHLLGNFIGANLTDAIYDEDTIWCGEFLGATMPDGSLYEG